MIILPPIVEQGIDIANMAKSTRIGVKALCLNADECLVLALNDDSYKLAGGGVKKGESLEAALEREFIEECGVYLAQKPKFSMSINEVSHDKLAKNTAFHHQTYFAICEFKSQDLRQINRDKYEQQLGMTPIWVKLNQLGKLFELGTQHNWAHRDRIIVNAFLKLRKHNDN